MTRSISAALVAAALSLLPTGSFTLDPASSRVEFLVRDNRGGFSGTARDIEAVAVVSEEDGTFAADVRVRVDARTITTGSGLRDGQMRRDFLVTDRFPHMSFQGTVVPVTAVTGLSFRAVARGRLTIRDTTRDVEVPLRITALRDTYLVEGTFTIRMTEFGIPIPRFLIFVADDPVEVTFKVRLAAR